MVSPARFERAVSGPPDRRFRLAKLRAAGAASRARTGYLPLTRRALCQMSQGGVGVLGRIPTANLPLRSGLPPALGFEDLVPPPDSTPGPRPSESRVLHLNYGGAGGGLGRSRTDILRIFSPALHPRFSFQPWNGVTYRNRTDAAAFTARRSATELTSPSGGPCQGPDWRTGRDSNPHRAP